ncbi:MAG: FAD-binding oxidoreductase [Angustibacter sp.]
MTDSELSDDLHLPAAVERLRAQYRALPPGQPVRLAKTTSNLFRPRERGARAGLDVSGLDEVFSVDREARTAYVGGMTTYEHLVDATLAHGLMPLVVPQLKTITIGGALTGLGIESSSWRAGLPHESALSIDVLTGAGDIVRATPDGPDAELFTTFPNSYGTLGYAAAATIELVPVHPYVHLRHIRFEDLDELSAAIDKLVAAGDGERTTWEGEPVDFIDASVFPPRPDDGPARLEAFLTLGTWADEAPYTSDYTGMGVYYRSVRSRHEDWLTVRDYLWRWDTDWFWCSRALGVQNPKIRRWVPKRLLRSDNYQRVIGLENRYQVKARIDARRGLPARERVVQDVEIPVERLAEFLRWFVDTVPIEPIWLCPLRLRRPAPTSNGQWPLYPLAPDELYVNVGFWSTVPIAEGDVEGDVNKRIEAKVAELDGHKSLYSDAYYGPEEFWKLYGRDQYEQAKRRYDPDSRLLDLYDKAVRRR